MLDLYRVYRHGKGNFNLELINENFVNIAYLDKNDISLKINENKNNISSNLIKINSNEDDILYNLSEINYIKSNIPKSYLKNVFNLLFYNKKTQIDFRNIFYEKVFEIDGNINDFIEIAFKIELEYQDTNDRHYVKSIYELFDEDNNRLYIKSITNNDYLYFSNKLFFDENTFYNFNKNIKKLRFVIKYQNTSSFRVIKVWYIKNDNYRLIIKNYGL